jgi:hypothetical protein
MANSCDSACSKRTFIVLFLFTRDLIFPLIKALSLLRALKFSKKWPGMLSPFSSK